MQKWNGFYLSDHTAQRNQESEANHAIQARALKEQMTLDDVLSIIAVAVKKNRHVKYQKQVVNIVDDNKEIPPIIQGKIEAYADNQIIISGERMTYDDLRWIEVVD